MSGKQREETILALGPFQWFLGAPKVGAEAQGREEVTGYTDKSGDPSLAHLCSSLVWEGQENPPARGS